MIDARFRLRLPPNLYITDLSRSFPATNFRLLSGVRTGDTASELGEVITDTPDAVVSAFREHEAIRGFEVLERTDDRLLTTYETTDVDLYVFSRMQDSHRSSRSRFGMDITSSTSPAPVGSSIGSGKRWTSLTLRMNSCRRLGWGSRNDS